LAAGIFGEVLELANDSETLLVLDPGALVSSAEKSLIAEAASPRTAHAR
jgi:hypothetical protein